MEVLFPDFNGVFQAGYAIEIKEGRHINTPQGEVVYLNHGTEYSVNVINFNMHTCRFTLNIDGKEQGSWQLKPKSSGNIRQANGSKRFTFHRDECTVEWSTSGNQNRLLTCSFTPEIGADSIDFTLSMPRRNPTKFSLFSKHSTKDLANRIRETLESKYKVFDTSKHDLIRWFSSDVDSCMRTRFFFDLDDDTKQFLQFDGCHEGGHYYIDCLPIISSVRIKYKGRTFEHRAFSEPKMKDVFQMVAELELPIFYLSTVNGRLFCSSPWIKTIENDHIYSLLRKNEILEAANAGILVLEVFDERPDPTSFDVLVYCLTGRVAPLLLSDDTSIKTVRLMLHMKEGLPPDQQRLIVAGRQLPDEGCVRDFPAIRETGIMHLILRLRSRKFDQSLQIKVGDVMLERDRSVKKKKTSPDFHLTEGTKTPGKDSRQSAQTVDAMRVDRSRETKFTLRLVERCDQEDVCETVDAADFPTVPSQESPPLNKRRLRSNKR